jgi:hypothetical protein
MHAHYFTRLERKHWWSLAASPRCKCGVWLSLRTEREQVGRL